MVSYIIFFGELFIASLHIFVAAGNKAAFPAARVYITIYYSGNITLTIQSFLSNINIIN